MQTTTFLQDAKIFMLERKGFIRRHSAHGGCQKDIDHIGDAMSEGAPVEDREAVVEYLNALIGGNQDHLKLVRLACGEVLYAKLVKAGLKRA